jgi:hypothetical protein
MEIVQSAYEEIDNLQMLLALYMEHEDTVLTTLIVEIRQRLEGLKACA